MSGSAARWELLERDADLARLRHALDDARAGAGRLVLVSGEAGIGKTNLIQAFLSEVRRDGSFRVLSGGCSYGSRTVEITSTRRAPRRSAGESGAAWRTLPSPCQLLPIFTAGNSSGMAADAIT